jgi:oligosaccharide repeat unit polymerase
MQNIKFTGYSLFFTALFIESVLLFLLAPRYFHYEFNLFCMLQYLASSFLFLKAKKKKNYFDFDVIFMFTFFFVMFFYPVFMFESDPTKYFAFQYEFNEDVISRATALSLLGMQSYFLGSLTFRGNKDSELIKTKIYNNITSLSIISAISFFLYIISGGYAKLASAYSGEDVADASGASTYLWAFTPAFLFCALAFQFNNLYVINRYKFQIGKLNKLLVIYTIVFVGLILLAGSRTFPLQIILICYGLYTLFYKPISFMKFIPLVVIGISAMFAINLMRGGGEISDLADIVMDLIICNRNTYVAVDYVDVSGITFGKSMLAIILSPIPLMQSIVFWIFSINPSDASSGNLITKISLGVEDSALGLGTNIIADLYMSFGMIGVILFMFLLGRYIAKFLHLAKSNMYALIAYSVMISYSVFLVRAEFFFFSRYLVWGLFFVFCAEIYNNSKKSKSVAI